MVYCTEEIRGEEDVMLTRVVIIVIKKLKQVMKIVMQKGPQVSLFIHIFSQFDC